VHVSSTARTGFKIELEVAVVLRDFDQMMESGVAQWSAAKIGMKNDTGRIDHRAERITPSRGKVFGNLLRQQIDILLQAVFCMLPGGDFAAQAGESFARCK
jgi:hypothetical protein